MYCGCDDSKDKLYSLYSDTLELLTKMKSKEDVNSRSSYQFKAFLDSLNIDLMLDGTDLKSIKATFELGKFDKIFNKEFKNIVIQKVVMDYIKTNIDTLIRKMIEDELPLYLKKEMIEIFLSSLNKFFEPFDLSYIGLSYSSLIKAIDERLEIEELYNQHNFISEKIKERLNDSIVRFNKQNLQPKITKLLDSFKDETGLHLNEKFIDLNSSDYVKLIEFFEARVVDVKASNDYEEVI